MKFSFIALALITSVSAHAKIIGKAPNQQGGYIVLTDEVCKFKGQTHYRLYKAYTLTEDGTSRDGCWMTNDDKTIIEVAWEDAGGQLSRYPSKLFANTVK
jgi:hypothetical protein